MAAEEEDLGLAFQLADAAAEISLARYRAADLIVQSKPDRTPVTESDQAVERALRELLSRARPNDAILGEEYGEQSPGTSGRRWVIDPIDGTASYLRGLPTWSNLISLMEDGEVVLGVVGMPALGRRWWARRGGGAFADGRRIHVSAVRSLGDAQLLWSGIEDWDAVGRPDAILALARAVWRTRGVGDAWQYMLVAEGAAEIALDPEAHLWDFAAMKIIVEEAGGRFTDLSGAVTAAGGSGLATNGLLHEAALSFVGRAAAS